ncbi:MAG: hypothetical protein ACRD47_09075 [Nitrososphaeraceae archaeon]
MAGRYSGRHIDKISLLKEAGIANFNESKSIKVPMIQDAAMNAECRLVKQEELGESYNACWGNHRDISE